MSILAHRLSQVCFSLDGSCGQMGQEQIGVASGSKIANAAVMRNTA
jgi:hypothetical protein